MSTDYTDMDKLEEPEKYIEPGTPNEHPSLAKSSAGWMGGLSRIVRGIPAVVWVANGHSSPITVVVHRFKPNSKTTGGGANAGPESAGVTIEGEMWTYPPTRKVLQPNQSAPFPLWSRSNGYASVSIFHGSGDSKTPVIENDRIGAGYSATYDGSATLYLTDFKGNEVE